MGSDNGDGESDNPRMLSGLLICPLLGPIACWLGVTSARSWPT